MQQDSPQEPLPKRRAPRIDRFLELALDRGASDFFFCVGQPPTMRLDGEIEPIRYRTLHQADFDLYWGEVTPPDKWSVYRKTWDVDFAYEIPNLARFRVNLFRQIHGSAAAVRLIPARQLTFEQLGLPAGTERFTRMRSGLVLITGPTGAGKSTTQSAIVNRLNEDFSKHIITIEDPVEFVHGNRKSLVTQREVGRSANSFSEAVRAALREDPDVVMVGEMRDRDTIQMALSAAETGLLVLGTLHTASASKTVDRVVNIFSHEDQDNVRSLLGSALRGILAQQLLRRKGGGRVAAFELLFGSPALSNLIREGKTAQIDSLIQLGRRDGMVTMDSSLFLLVKDGLVEPRTAYEKAIDKNAFRRILLEDLDISLGQEDTAEQEMLELVEKSD